MSAVADDIETVIARVKAETDWERWQSGWLQVFRACGHVPVLDDDGAVDLFVTNPNGHNGPGCQACDWTRCMHCCAVDQIPVCTKPSVSGQPGERL